MPFFEQLQALTAPDRDRLQTIPIIRAALRGEVSRERYLAYLAEAYHHVRHTVPLLMACGARLPARHEWLRDAMARYIEEELGHQEWILKDIAAAGGDAEAVRDGEPSMETELMVAYAYDTIARGNPVGFLGMVYVLEGTSVTLATQAAGALQASLGLPSKAFVYLTSHGSVDVGHMAFFAGLVNRLEDATDRAAVVHAARRFFRLYGDIFRALDVEVTA